MAKRLHAKPKRRMAKATKRTDERPRAPRNPQDSTRRNVQAANKRMAALELRVDALEQQLKSRSLFDGVAKMSVPEG